MSGIKGSLRTVVWLLPASRPKNRLLTMLGHPVHPTATARSNLVRHVAVVSMGAHSRIARWNLIRNLRLLTIADHATVGRFNVISAHPVFARLYPDGASLSVAEHAYVTSRHHLDCSGSIAVGAYASIAGHSSTVLTHSIDLRKDVQSAYPVVIGERSFIGAGCTILGGAELPAHSVLGAGSVLTRSSKRREPGLWAGSPATNRGPVDGEWFRRTKTGTNRVFIPATGETVDDAF
jgi:Acetyltransferase (isoleucine patch superfamily)